VREALQDTLQRVCGGGRVTCRFTHVYPDGPAPYFTFEGLGRHGAELEMHEEIKRAASDAIIAAGGTITHHHAVGRVHRPWYDQERPDPFAQALRAAKGALDPRGVLNPGVLIDP
jgi:alkyldihydroxyacetonephosphate synthase